MVNVEQLEAYVVYYNNLCRYTEPSTFKLVHKQLHKFIVPSRVCLQHIEASVTISYNTGLFTFVLRTHNNTHTKVILLITQQ